MQDEKLLKEARTLFNSLKRNLSSGLYSEERIDTKKLNTFQQTVEKTKNIEIFKGCSAIKTYKFS